MAPNRGRPGPSGKTSGKRPGSSVRDRPRSSLKGKPGKRVKPKATSGPLKKEQRKTAAFQVKAPKKQKQRTYTDAELGLPKLNKITPAGIQKPKGKKKGKVFIDDPESMMTILAMVSAEKDGQIESQMVKARQMEEIREARRREQERKEEMKKEKLEEVKDSLRKKRRRRKHEEAPATSINEVNGDEATPKKRKRVSFV